MGLLRCCYCAQHPVVVKKLDMLNTHDYALFKLKYWRSIVSRRPRWSYYVRLVMRSNCKTLPYIPENDSECGLLMSRLGAETSVAICRATTTIVEPSSPQIDSHHFSPLSPAFLLPRRIWGLQIFQPLHLFVVPER